MRIDTSSISRPTDMNKPAETDSKVTPSETKADVNVPMRNHFVRERRRENRRISGDERRRKGRRQGEIRESTAKRSPYDSIGQLDETPTQGPERMVDIDC